MIILWAIISLCFNDFSHDEISFICIENSYLELFFEIEWIFVDKNSKIFIFRWDMYIGCYYLFYYISEYQII